MKTKDHLLMEDVYNQIMNSQLNNSENLLQKFEDMAASISNQLGQLRQLLDSEEWKNFIKNSPRESIESQDIPLSFDDYFKNYSGFSEDFF